MPEIRSAQQSVTVYDGVWAWIERALMHFWLHLCCGKQCLSVHAMIQKLFFACPCSVPVVQDSWQTTSTNHPSNSHRTSAIPSTSSVTCQRQS
jgi:hypothetical protein